MNETANALTPIITSSLCSSAKEVIRRARTKTAHPYLLDAKLGNANTGPTPDTVIAAAHQTPPGSLGRRLTRITNTLRQVDQQLRNPLNEIALKTNDIIARAAILNRHNRRPPLYAEKTITVLIKLGFATPEHAPLIRAAGYVYPPPVVSLTCDIDDIMADIAAHMARSQELQSSDDILQSLSHLQGDLSNWPELDITLFIRRVAGQLPDERGLYHPDQPWGTLIKPPHLVANTVLHILARDQQPRTAKYLIGEIERLVGRHLPVGYNVINAFNNFAYKSGLTTLHGLSTFGLRAWGQHQETHRAARSQGTTIDHIHVFLMENGPADIEAVIEHVLLTTNVQRRTVQNAINRDPSGRLIRLSDRRVAANPTPQDCNPDALSFAVVPDDHSQLPTPVLRESELVWLTRYVKALGDLEPPLPTKVVLTGPRAAGSTLSGQVEITVVADEHDWVSLEPRLKKIAATAAKTTPSTHTAISMLTPQGWEHQQESNESGARYNVWLAPDAAE